MYAQCPECLTVFPLDAETLAQARGTVTCGYCSGTFDALASLTEQLPAEPFGRLPTLPMTGPVPRLQVAVYRPSLEGAPVPIDPAPATPLDSPVLSWDVETETDEAFVAPALTETDLPASLDLPALPWEMETHEVFVAPAPIEPPAPGPVVGAAVGAEATAETERNEEPASGEPPPAPAPPSITPRFARGRRARQRGRSTTRPRHERRWPWVAVCVGLLLALGAQLAWAKRDALISDPGIGGWLRSACATLGCRLPAVRDVRLLRLVARDVRTRPGPGGALSISATVRNDAPFTQPWPVVTLTLSDAHGKPVAMRRLHPRDYLADRAALRAGLPPGGSVALLFEVRDPGATATLFQFAFE